MNANDYINILNNHQNNYIFQDDNAQIHRAKSTLQWISENNIDQLFGLHRALILILLKIFGMN